MNLITPAGNKIRSQSRRRYVLVADVNKVLTDERSVQRVESSAHIEQRSDNLTTLRTAKARKGNYFDPFGGSVQRHIMDNLTGEVLS